MSKHSSGLVALRRHSLASSSLQYEWKARLSIDSLASINWSSPLPTPAPKPRWVRWFPPSPGTIKLNFDGSSKGNSAAAGVVLRDHQGHCISARTFPLGNTSPLVAEALALRNGLFLAREFGFSSIFIERDNLIVINVLQGKSCCPWKIQLLMDDIRSILRDFRDYASTHVYREANQSADYIASLGHWAPTHVDINPYMDAKFSFFFKCRQVGLFLREEYNLT